MRKERIISLINNPHLINKEDNKFLEDISEKYPYFSISHILLSKGLLNIESVRYNRKLKQAALYSIDRKQLFKLILEQKKVTSDIVKEKNKVIELERPLNFEEKKNRIKNWRTFRI